MTTFFHPSGFTPWLRGLAAGLRRLALRGRGREARGPCRRPMFFGPPIAVPRDARSSRSVPPAPKPPNWIDQSAEEARPQERGLHRVPQGDRGDAFLAQRRARLHRLPRRQPHARPHRAQGARRAAQSRSSGKAPPSRPIHRCCSTTNRPNSSSSSIPAICAWREKACGLCHGEIVRKSATA